MGNWRRSDDEISQSCRIEPEDVANDGVHAYGGLYQLGRIARGRAEIWLGEQRQSLLGRAGLVGSNCSDEERPPLDLVLGAKDLSMRHGEGAFQ